ncbi:PREDICTED: protein CREG1-like [Acropora digitifera]|uniref:protein CREG1-like n=1 Tax=Acropora digitifera TaxID=70779 RepID=UPI00077A2169|nr:PREDICTED: protein CREG1-like [Acropora digitifera]
MESAGCEDKVKLLIDDPEAPPGVSLKKDDSKRSYSIWGITTSLVLSVLLIYVSWGTLMAFWDQNQKQPETILIDAENDGEYRELRVYHPGKSHPQEKWHKIGEDGKDIQDIHDHNIMNNKFVNSFDPPPRSEKAKTARYIVHNSIWGSISIISKSLEGAPFSMAMSFSDGTVDNSTGILYFYMSAFDPIVRNMKFNNLASFSVSEAQSDYCKDHNWDPEEPLCSRVSLNGRLVHVDSKELKFAQNALFSRHPVMKTWPKNHRWQTLKLNITRVWLQDIYGPPNIISVEDYLKANLKRRTSFY